MHRRIIALMLCILLASSSALADEPVRTRLSPDLPVPDYVTWLLEVATGEIGYTEGERGYTKYGEWAGDPNTQWCAEFLCWSVDQVDQLHGTSLLKNVYPLYSGQNTGRDWFIRQGRYVTRTGYLNGWGYQWYPGQEGYLRNGSYIPQPGDWVFFTWTDDEDTDHVAMVEYSSVDEKGVYYVHVIEGNNPSGVARNVYRLKDDKILGYGTVHSSVGTTMRGGNTSVQVSEFQQKLVDLGYLDSKYATGTYGPSTTTAVRNFQKEYGLAVNGRASREMQEKLTVIYGDYVSWLVSEDPPTEETNE